MKPMLRVEPHVTDDAPDAVGDACPTDVATITPNRAVTATNSFFIPCPPSRSRLRRWNRSPSLRVRRGRHVVLLARPRNRLMFPTAGPVACAAAILYRKAQIRNGYGWPCPVFAG